MARRMRDAAPALVVTALVVAVGAGPAARPEADGGGLHRHRERADHRVHEGDHQGAPEHRPEAPAAVDRGHLRPVHGREGQYAGRRHLGGGRDEHAHLQERGDARALCPEGPRQDRPAVPRQGQSARLGRHGHLHVGVLLQYRGGQEAQPARADVLGGPDQAGVQGPRGDAESRLVRHRVSLGRVDPAAHGRGGGLEVPRRAPPEHRRVHASPARSPARTPRRGSAPWASPSSTSRTR